MAQVLLDLRMVSGQLHGIARYALELARRLPRLAPSWSFTALVGPDGLPANLGPLRPDLPTLTSSARFLSVFEQPSLLVTLAGTRFDLFHATSFSLPALWNGPLVATLHDANHLALPENYGPGRATYYRLVVGPRARRARALITVSEFSRQELARHLDISPFRFQVIHNGVDERFRPQGPSDIAALRKRLRLPERFLLAVGNQKPHKNLGLLARTALHYPLPLAVLAGRGAVRRLSFPTQTIDLGELSEDDLPLLYASATALLFPSSYEGFGLPVIEAMACGTPVLAAKASSIPEIAGEAALLLDPWSEDEWKDAVYRICRDAQLRESLRAAGLERAARFTWDDCARRTLAVYERALDRRPETRP